LSVAVHLLAFGRHLGFPKDYLAQLGMVGLLLDVGMLKVPTAILDKKVVLSSEEFDAVRNHVSLGVEILRGIPGLHPSVLEGIAQHHERENGSGYPARLSAERISIFGRMAAIVDTFTAMTNKRSYREPAAAYEVLRELSAWAGTFFNARMVEQFIQSIGVFPAGSLVELSTGEVAVVVSHNKARRLKPRVLIITAPDKSVSPRPANLDLLHQAQIADRDPVYIVRGLPTGAYGVSAHEYYVK
jgi:HD-GYP domain-containing protein (c-di-GMP phosphodiesterase class II)